MKLSVLSLAFVLSAVVAPSLSGDTLSYFDPHSASIFYRDQGIAAQAARFDLPAPGYVRRLTLWLSGKTTGSGTVTIYGNEGAFAAPLLGQPLGYPTTFHKDRPGLQKVEVVLPGDLFVPGPQFFVVLSDLSDGIVWLSDQREKRPRCAAGTNQWLYQAIKGKDGLWRAGKYGYAVEAVVDYPQAIPPTYLSDITLDAGFPEELLLSVSEAERGGSIAWADIDNDLRPDLLLGGRLFINKGEDRFEEATERLGDAGGTRAHHFIDIENDGDPDILLLGLKDGATALLENDGDGYFNRHALALPPITNPSTVSFADVDADGDLDAFIGQGRTDTGAALPSYLLLNNRAKGFVPSIPITSNRTEEAESDHAALLSAQWIDYDNDGDPDLSITTDAPDGNSILLNDGSGRLTLLQRTTLSAQSTNGQASGSLPLPALGEGGSERSSETGEGLLSPGDWADADNNGKPDLLQPVTYPPHALGGLQSALATPHSAIDTRSYLGFNGAGIWGDADNDGRLDALLTSACDCRFAALYVQDPSGGFEDQSFDYGLFRLPAGADGVWVDFNNDGKLDLATFVGGGFRLLKNTGEFGNTFIEADLSGSELSSATVGGTVTIYADGNRQTRPITSGRGALMQGPLRVHFGLGNAGSVDSMVVEWGEEHRRTVIAPALNRVHYPFKEEGSASTAASQLAFSAWPNPFRGALNFRYTVPEKSAVRLTVHRLDGELLSVVVDADQEAGEQSAEWRAVDQSGGPLPAGTYIYRVRIGSQVLTGRAVLAK